MTAILSCVSNQLHLDLMQGTSTPFAGIDLGTLSGLNPTSQVLFTNEILLLNTSLEGKYLLA